MKSRTALARSRMLRSMKRLVPLMVSVIALGSAAAAAGIDSRTYTCASLQSLVSAQGFVFISQATFGDFVVANVSYCPGGSVLEWRTVATSDRPQCLVNYCVSRNTGLSN